jgi:SAM-dependent methyltransferase
MTTTKSNTWENYPELVHFYTTHRCAPKDLYPSERRFLPWLADNVASVLDVGCAAGGFENIWKYYNSKIDYTGVDLSSILIEAAKELHPNSKFIRADPVVGIPLNDSGHDLVQALGWLFWEPKYKKALSELWRLTNRWLFLDIRLVDSPANAQTGEQHMEFGVDWDGETTTPYLTVAWPEFAKILLELKPASVFGFGYMGKPADNVVGVTNDVCFAVFAIERSVSNEEKLTDFCVQLPFEIPVELLHEINLMPTDELSRLVPEKCET